MEIWLDTCNIEIINAADRLGLVYGITTNPSILAATPNAPQQVIDELLEAQDGPVAVQVTEVEAADMIRQAQSLRAISDRIIVKIPVVKQGLIAMKDLAAEGVPLMGTAVFQPAQALFAALAGADYVAPYIGRMLDVGVNAFASLETMMNIYRSYGLKTKILGAALRTTEQIMNCASLGLHSVTLKDALFLEFFADDPNTTECLKTFDVEWRARKSNTTSHPQSVGDLH